MRVLMTADAVGGVWNYCLTLGQSLESHGFETHLAVMGPAPSPAQQAQARNLTVHHSPFALEWMPAPWADVDAAGNWLLSLERELSPAVVHLNGYAHGALEFRAPKVIVAHSCVCSWWRAVHGEAAPASWDEYRRRVVAGLDSSDAVISVSSAMSEALKQEYGRTAEQVIYNAANTETPHLTESAVTKNLAVFCAGRFWDEGKNLRLVEQASRSINAEIFAAGDGWMSDYVWCLGQLSPAEMRNWYQKCAIFCHPASYEPFGLAALEAAAMGCALVLGDIPSLREIWRDSALYADSRNPEILAQSVNLLLENPALLKHMSDKANQRAGAFTAERQAQEYAEVYGSLTNSGPERASFRP